MFQVRFEQLTIDPNRSNDVEDYYLNLAKAYASNGTFDDNVSDQIKVYKNNNLYFVVDYDTMEVYGVNDYKLNQSLINTSAYSTSVAAGGQNASIEIAKVVMDSVFGMLTVDGGGGGGDDKRRRRKKKI